MSEARRLEPERPEPHLLLSEMFADPDGCIHLVEIWPSDGEEAELPTLVVSSIDPRTNACSVLFGATRSHEAVAAILALRDQPDRPDQEYYQRLLELIG